MAKITLHGNEINTNGDLPTIGEQAPTFSLVNSELADVGLENFSGKKKLLNIIGKIGKEISNMLED
jgi:thiol peroxidase